ncbi:uncharacterized protein WCC33_003344 [Rhinophrynus dorsalis]
MNLDKCEFERSRLQFLGYIISKTGLEMDPAKVRAVTNWPVPRDVRAIQRFIGFSHYYRKFIKDFSRIIAPITALTKGTADPKNWPPEALKAFESLKTAFTTAPILHFPDPSRQFIVEVDASELGAGAVLSQKDPGTA